jgi:hypothetical protein
MILRFPANWRVAEIWEIRPLLVDGDYIIKKTSSKNIPEIYAFTEVFSFLETSGHLSAHGSAPNRAKA